MELWESVYPDNLLIALTDTLTTEVFFAVYSISKTKNEIY
jgi:hypothetical protein